MSATHTDEFLYREILRLESRIRALEEGGRWTFPLATGDEEIAPVSVQRDGTDGATVLRWFNEDGNVRHFGVVFRGVGPVADSAEVYLDGVRMKLVPAD